MSLSPQLTSRMENFSRSRNMVCPRHGVSVGSCTHDVDLTPDADEDQTTPVKETGATGGIVAEVVLDRVEEFAEVPLDEHASNPCKCSDDDDDHEAGRATGVREEKMQPTSRSQVHHDDDDEKKVAAGKAEPRPTGLLSKEVYLTPSLPGAPDEESPSTPPPAHPLTPETLITGRARSAFDRDTPSASPSPSSSSSRAIVGFEEAKIDEASLERRPASALSNLSTCTETTRLNGAGL